MASSKSKATRLITLSLLLGAAGCSLGPKYAYTPAELRAEVARRAPRLAAAEVVVPAEVSEADAERAREIVRNLKTDGERVRALAEAVFSPTGFDLHYSESVTATAADTLRTREGNCLAISSAFVGLARAAGLQASFMDASVRVHDTRQAEDGMTVNAGHISAVVRAGDQVVGLDFPQLGRIRWYRVIDDVEALAHFYNNRGFEILETSPEGAERWEEAARDFTRAVQVIPGFSRAWNNLGIAEGHRGRVAEALSAYQKAIAADPSFAAPHNNLGSLWLRQGRLAEALASLQAAAQLDPRAPHIQYNLALALVASGDRERAAEALRRAIRLRGGYPEAEGILARLQPEAGAATTP
jgi:tetratricopeptide (TPR) repeat protein